MNKSLIAAPLAALLLSACVVAPPGRGNGAAIGIGLTVPTLPLVVELGSDPYYDYGGYTYYYNNDRWRYAGSRGGPWVVSGALSRRFGTLSPSRSRSRLLGTPSRSRSRPSWRPR